MFISHTLIIIIILDTLFQIRASEPLRTKINISVMQSRLNVGTAWAGDGIHI
jgi:hypothetical protein